MNLESATKYFFCKTQSFTDSPRSTGDTMTGTDVLGAFGLCQSQAELGFKAFLGKLGLSPEDSKRAIQLLVHHGMKHCDKVAALRKLDTKIKLKVVQVLATFAFKDYCRSASGVEQCVCCKGEGFTTDKKATAQDRKIRPYSAPTRILCTKCNGKGSVSVACRDCRGRGVSVDQKQTELQGVPVMQNCRRCLGRGYERVPAADTFRAICAFTDTLSAATWDKSIKPFYDTLITHLEKEESWAEQALNRVTK